MRNIFVGAVVLIFGAIMLIAYLTITLAAHTALVITREDQRLFPLQ